MKILQNPMLIATVAAIGIHGVILLILPSTGKPDEAEAETTVEVVELTPDLQPQFEDFPPQQFELPPLQADLSPLQPSENFFQLDPSPYESYDFSLNNLPPLPPPAPITVPRTFQPGTIAVEPFPVGQWPPISRREVLPPPNAEQPKDEKEVEQSEEPSQPDKPPQASDPEQNNNPDEQQVASRGKVEPVDPETPDPPPEPPEQPKLLVDRLREGFKTASKPTDDTNQPPTQQASPPPGTPPTQPPTQQAANPPNGTGGKRQALKDWQQTLQNNADVKWRNPIDLAVTNPTQPPLPNTPKFVSARVLVDSSGKIKSMQVSNSGDPALNKVIADALSKRAQGLPKTGESVMYQYRFQVQ